MKTFQIVPVYSAENLIHLRDFQEAIYNSNLNYSLRHLTFAEDNSPKNILEAIQKSMKVCELAGIQSKHHFKKIYIYDDNLHTLCVDWRMSKKGFNLMVMHFPSLNQDKARWFWELSSK